ncbi:MAG: hypothetical protein ACTHJ3_04695 [Pararhizobium sp.]
MKSVLVLMIILGCDDSETLCRHLKTVDGGYRSVATCTDASTQEIMKFSGVDYPVVVARCETSDQLGIATADAAPGEPPSPEATEPDAGPPDLSIRAGAATVVAWTESAAASAWHHIPGTAEVRTFIGTQGERVWKAFSSRVPWGRDDDPS